MIVDNNGNSWVTAREEWLKAIAAAEELEQLLAYIENRAKVLRTEAARLLREVE